MAKMCAYHLRSCISPATLHTNGPPDPWYILVWNDRCCSCTIQMWWANENFAEVTAYEAYYWERSEYYEETIRQLLWTTTHSFTDTSSSGAVFLKKVGCHDSPLLPILSHSHDVFVSHSRPFRDICQHPSIYYSKYRQFPSPQYVPLERMSPTSRACYYHCLRVLLQVTTWCALQSLLHATTIASGYSCKWPHGVPFNHSSAQQTNLASSLRMEHLCQSLQKMLRKSVDLASQPSVSTQHVGLSA